MIRKPGVHQLIDGCERLGRQPFRQVVPLGRGIRVLQFCGDREPLQRLDFVLLDAETVLVHRAEVDLGIGDAVLGRKQVPLHGLGFTHGHAPAVGVHDAECTLRFAMPLCGGQSVPFQSQCVIQRHAVAVGIQQAHAELACGVAAFGARGPDGHGPVEVSDVVGPAPGLVVAGEHH